MQKQKVFLSSAILFILALSILPMVAAEESSTEESVELRIMQHLCYPHIRSVSDFNQMSIDKSEYAAHVTASHSCPSVVLPHDDILDESEVHDHAEHRSFNFLIASSEDELTMSDAEFVSEKLCEDEASYDIDGDGVVSAESCIETSYYVVSGIKNSLLSVKQTEVPGNSVYAFTKFSPGEEDDASTLIEDDYNTRTVLLDATKDDDGVITLHVYNFWDTVIRLNPENICEAGPRAYHGDGSIVSVEDSYPIEAAWIRDTSAAKGSGKTIAEGKIKIDEGLNAERFDLIYSDSSKGIIIFNVETEGSNERIGDLTLWTSESSAGLWNGNLSIEEGDFEGEYSVEIRTKSVLVEETEGIESLIEEENIFSFDTVLAFFENVLDRMGY